MILALAIDPMGRLSRPDDRPAATDGPQSQDRADGLPRFEYVDTATGGADRRNRVMRLAYYEPPLDIADCYTTVLRFPDDLFTYAAANPKPSTGEPPSVAGYPGPARAEYLPLDFDDEADPARALADLRRFLRWIEANDVPLRALRLYFSGHKGFHVEVPAVLFGGFAPGADLHRRLERLARRLLDGYPTADLKIYDKLRLWRCANTRHGKSNLYKVPLAPEEVLDGDLPAIRALAGAPRLLPTIPDDEWSAVPALTELWREAAEPAQPVDPRQAMSDPRALAGETPGNLVAVLRPHYVLRRRHYVALGLAGWLATRGVPREDALGVVRGLGADDEELEDRLQAVEDTYAKVEAGGVVAGWSLLGDLVPREALIDLERCLNAPVPSGAAAGAAEAGPGAAAKPVVNLDDPDLAALSDRVWEAVREANRPPVLFRFGGALCRIVTPGGRSSSDPVSTVEKLRYELVRMVSFVRTSVGRGTTSQVPDAPQRELLSDLLCNPDPPVPPLERIVPVPVFAPSGELVATAGYHPGSGIFYAPPPGFAVAHVRRQPDCVEVDEARRLIVEELLGDFPFRADSDRAHAVGLLLLPFVRDLIDGPTPLSVVEAPDAGTGKGLLAEALLRPAAGGSVPVMAPANDDDEWRKRITAKLRDAPAAVLIDNVRKPLDAAALAAVLTATVWEDRALGTHDTVRLPNRCAWVCTGNNVRLSDELTRRSARIRLDAGMEHPEERTGFRHPRLRQWVAARRADLVWAALALVRHWLAEGAPDGGTQLGSYEAWSSVVGGVLQTAGIPGFLADRREFDAVANDERRAWSAFVARWGELHGTSAVGVAGLMPIADEIPGLDLGEGGERPRRTRLGIQLGNRRDRVIGGFRIADAGVQHRAQQWRLEPVGTTA